MTWAGRSERRPSTRWSRTAGSWSSRTTRACRSFSRARRPRSAATSRRWPRRSSRCRRRSPPGAEPMSDPRPIGVFDSGVGGLTVLREILRRTPQESLTYLGDNARAPYGTRPDAEVRRYSIECLDRLVDGDVKALVVACNTSTAVALGEYRRRYDIPVLGVIRPGAQAAALATRTRRVGVIATPATIRSHAYFDAIKEENPAVEVYEHATPTLVPLVEAGVLSGDAAVAAVAEALGPLLGRRDEHGEFIHPLPPSARIDTLLLGCTHYPLLRSIIQAAVGEGVAIVDSATATAGALAELLSVNGLEAPGTTRGTAADAGRAGHDAPGERALPPTRRLLTTGNLVSFQALVDRLFGTDFPSAESAAVGGGLGGGEVGPEEAVDQGLERHEVPGGQQAAGGGQGSLPGRVVARASGIRRGPAGGARRLEAVDGEQLGERPGRRGRAVDDRDALAHRRLDDRPEERVVRAPQQERVNSRRRRQRLDELAVLVPPAEQRAQRLGDRGNGGVAGKHAGLHERHEGRRRVLVDLDGRVLLLDRVEVRVRADRGGRGDHAHPARPRGERRGLGPGPDDPQRGDVVPAPVLAERDGGGRVAGDDQRLDVPVDEAIEALDRIAAHLGVGPRPVRGPGVVAEVGQALLGRPSQDLAEDGQAAHAGVEDTDRARVGHRLSAGRRPAPAP